ncbi:phosphopantothenoylcysteine decarboxylase isoform X1 [Callorhinchus milii]|uniref:Phosphopantothenoylcysteine decarboxylase n=1 Tax=Callorhinchus milii TaxID=7868 RepID=V9L0R4_CALMI|nr:phosphopantothenoylcysteine decarboxylase isoform X1 [Callorhinchus milii]|eukprot:gi/632939092/ref/XP_007907620.1/ PREDICTED: phosphopantothenoylcysteine decarboxylase isoform X1 [Callorhinchus milii]
MEREVEAVGSSAAAERRHRVLVAVTGSVAALKLPELVRELRGLRQMEVKVVTTHHAKHFYDQKDVAVKIYSDSDEWEVWKKKSDPVLHIDLRRWADLMVIAPLDANTLGKIACGICDNLLTCVVRAWDMKRPLLFCPAMNTAMWEHPITATQIETLKCFGYIEIPCIAKKLACGDEGYGAMAEVCTIVEKVEECLQQRFPAANQDEP